MIRLHWRQFECVMFYAIPKVAVLKHNVTLIIKIKINFNRFERYPSSIRASLFENKKPIWKGSTLLKLYTQNKAKDLDFRDSILNITFPNLPSILELLISMYMFSRVHVKLTFKSIKPCTWKIREHIFMLLRTLVF